MRVRVSEELLWGAEQAADFAGSSYWAHIGGELVYLRPDWVEVVLTECYDAAGRQVGWKRLGYLYFEGGKSGADPAVFLPHEVVHFTEKPDPLAKSSTT